LSEHQRALARYGRKFPESWRAMAMLSLSDDIPRSARIQNPGPHLASLSVA
ncbi:hypothetical protein A2U01_0067167, partial [Trifolium medium]|nr:hypothetical protein [Trifolium medium]